MYAKKELHTIRLPLACGLLVVKSLFVGLLFFTLQALCVPLLCKCQI